ncbi:polysaccharide export protein [Marinagarivorans cellulosilyticus]|uniref:Polysaccharide biosynthesis/export protein n=1 Tax=Marinagarivorans cellulosilyticus TaxID=2721545 RepID=A0AAN1WG71_9GAMM|nr:polysaccharide export protein [Marinagarivorans cellulosilyticus]BCD97014.1 polysaccharide biosynthesis/export protein [Marinagarivorans cellulosilyticus]
MIVIGYMARLAIYFILLPVGFINLSGCAFAPGAYVDANDGDIEDVVDIQPITIDLIAQMANQPKALKPSGISPADSIAGYDYLIGRGDVLSIIVYDHPELTIPAGSERSAAESGNVVHSDGTIFYPYIGQVNVAGRTVRDVRNEMQTRLADFVAKPQVDVKVVAFNAQKTYVTGQVSKPGTFAITNVPVRVLDALSFAGGLTEDANWRNVILTRDGIDTALSVYDMLTLGDLSQNYLLKNGDVLHVPEAGNQLAIVMGEVRNPTTFTLGNNRMSLTSAIAKAGGLNQITANASGVFVIRRTANKEKFATIYQLDASNAAAFALGSEFMLEPTDVVYVTAAPVSRWNRVLSQLLPSITAIYQMSEIGVNLDSGQRP